MQNSKEGFYCRWDKDICLLFCRKAGIEVDIQFMDTLFQSLLERNFFDTNLFHKFGILTSRSIQIRFFEATVRRRKIKESIVEENKFTTAATRVRGAGKRTGESE
nr:DUF4373 domain-containing protein [uncultured Parabacteroides sp.]